jgi:hypothetical protein
VTPVTLGGTHDVSNLRWVHRDANQAKHALTDAAFYRLCTAVAATLRPRLVAAAEGEQRALL